jgi:enamine deaminase RidA (YjgF/YER057c/UK114 family)
VGARALRAPAAAHEGRVNVEKRLAELGLPLRDLEQHYRTNPSGAHFSSHLAHQNVLHLSGTTPIKDGKPYLPGVLGRDLTIEQGYEAARYAMLMSLGVLAYALGDLDRVEQALQLTGFVNSAPGFSDQPRVVNGATDLLVELYGDRGRPTRAAIGCQGLAGNASVEVVLSVVFAGSTVRPPLARDRHQR